MAWVGETQTTPQPEGSLSVTVREKPPKGVSGGTPANIVSELGWDLQGRQVGRDLGEKKESQKGREKSSQ